MAGTDNFQIFNPNAQSRERRGLPLLTLAHHGAPTEWHLPFAYVQTVRLTSSQYLQNLCRYAGEQGL